MIPQIMRIRDWLLKWFQGQLLILTKTAPVDTLESMVDPQIRQWFTKLLADSRGVGVDKISDKTVLTAQEVVAAMTMFKKEFCKDIAPERFQGHWGAVSVGEFLLHADYCYHSRRPSSPNRRSV